MALEMSTLCWYDYARPEQKLTLSALGGQMLAATFEQLGMADSSADRYRRGQPTDSDLYPILPDMDVPDAVACGNYSEDITGAVAVRSVRLGLLLDAFTTYFGDRDQWHTRTPPAAAGVPRHIRTAFTRHRSTVRLWAQAPETLGPDGLIAGFKFHHVRSTGLPFWLITRDELDRALMAVDSKITADGSNYLSRPRPKIINNPVVTLEQRQASTARILRHNAIDPAVWAQAISLFRTAEHGVAVTGTGHP